MLYTAFSLSRGKAHTEPSYRELKCTHDRVTEELSAARGCIRLLLASRVRPKVIATSVRMSPLEKLMVKGLKQRHAGERLITDGMIADLREEVKVLKDHVKQVEVEHGHTAVKLAHAEIRAAKMKNALVDLLEWVDSSVPIKYATSAPGRGVTAFLA